MERQTQRLRYTHAFSAHVAGYMDECVNECNALSLSLQITMDDYCGEENEEKNPYPANDYIGTDD